MRYGNKPKNWMFDVDQCELDMMIPKSSQEEAFEDYCLMSLASALGSLIVLGVAALIYWSIT